MSIRREILDRIAARLGSYVGKEASSAFASIADGERVVRALRKHKRVAAMVNLDAMSNLVRTRALPSGVGGRIDSLNLIDVRRLVCASARNAIVCSKHGRCDPLSRRCVCDKYWMPSLLAFLDGNDNDNCGQLSLFRRFFFIATVFTFSPNQCFPN